MKKIKEKFLRKILLGILVLCSFLGVFSPAVFAIKTPYLNKLYFDIYVSPDVSFVCEVKKLTPTKNFLMDLISEYIRCFEDMMALEQKKIEFKDQSPILVFSENNHIGNVISNVAWDLFKTRMKSIILSLGNYFDFEVFYTLIDMIRCNVVDRYNEYLQNYDIQVSQDLTERELKYIYSSACKRYSELVEGFGLLSKMRLYSISLKCGD